MFGWEYMDLVEEILRPELRELRLRRTCGEWPKLMRELSAIVLFGVRFSEAIQPVTANQLCSRLQYLPVGNDYLAMEVQTLQRLYRESGSSDHGSIVKLTPSGSHLRRSALLFEPCPLRPRHDISSGESCSCRRFQEIVWRTGGDRITTESTGAIIIGKSLWTDLLRTRKADTQPMPRGPSLRTILPWYAPGVAVAPSTSMQDIADLTLESTFATEVSDATDSSRATEYSSVMVNSMLTESSETTEI